MNDYIAQVRDRLPPMPPKVKKALGIARLLSDDMNRCDTFKHAYSMAYITLLSLVPSLAAVFSLVSLFTPLMSEDRSLYEQARTLVLQNLTAGTGEQVMVYIEKFVENLDIKKIGITGFAGMIVTLILLLRQIEMALNRVFLVTKPRNMLTRFVYFWTFLTLGTFIGSLSVGVLSGFDASNLLPWGADKVREFNIWAYLFPPVSLWVFFGMLYKLVPNCRVDWRAAMIGSFVSTVLFTVASEAYTFYTSSFTNYQAIYGALAAIPLFLVWLYVLWLITLFGSLITWRAQQGFEVEEATVDDANPQLTSREKFRNYQLQSLTPLILLIAIMERHEDAQGLGVSGAELHRKLNLPAPWIIDGIQYLLEMRYVVAAEESDDEAIADPLAHRYYPARPAARVGASEIETTLHRDAQEWLRHWRHDWPCALESATRWLNEQSLAPDTKKTLSDLLADMRTSSSSQATTEARRRHP